MRSGIIYATLIIILVFIPLFALSGIEGRLFAPLGIAYIVSILGSLITSITVTPVLCYYFLPRMRLAEADSFLVRRLKRGDARLLAWSFGQAPLLPGVCAIAVVIAGFAATKLTRAFLPPFNEGTLTIGMTFSPGIALAESNRLGAVAERLIEQVPEVRSVGRRTGRGTR